MCTARLGAVRMPRLDAEPTVIAAERSIQRLLIRDLQAAPNSGGRDEHHGTSTTQPPRQNGVTGRIMNVFWTTIDAGTLRQASGYAALRGKPQRRLWATSMNSLSPPPQSTRTGHHPPHTVPGGPLSPTPPPPLRPPVFNTAHSPLTPGATPVTSELSRWPATIIVPDRIRLDETGRARQPLD